MKENFTKELIKPISKNVENLTIPLTEKVGEGFGNLFDLILGSHIKLAREKQIYRQGEKLEKYKAYIKDKISAIPEDQVISNPPMHVVGPAIEAAKFYIEDDNLSEMFSNLIAASFDINKSQNIHPAFTEIIKQLSPLDAKNVITFKAHETQPICDIQIFKRNIRGYTMLYDYFYINEFDVGEDQVKLNTNSIMNLLRLGLLESHPLAALSDEKLYKKFYEHEFYKNIEVNFDLNLSKHDRIQLQHRYVKLTSLGKSFLEVVI